MLRSGHNDNHLPSSELRALPVWHFEAKSRVMWWAFDTSSARLRGAKELSGNVKEALAPGTLPATIILLSCFSTRL